GISFESSRRASAAVTPSNEQTHGGSTFSSGVRGCGYGLDASTTFFRRTSSAISPRLISAPMIGSSSRHHALKRSVRALPEWPPTERLHRDIPPLGLLLSLNQPREDVAGGACDRHVRRVRNHRRTSGCEGISRVEPSTGCGRLG